MNDRAMDAEQMAALLDGRLSADRRAALLAEMDASPDDLELLADAAAVLGELEAMGELTAPADRASPLHPDADAGLPRAESRAASDASKPATPELPAASMPVDGRDVSDFRIETDPPLIASQPSPLGASEKQPGVLALDVERTRRRGVPWKAVLPIAAVLVGMALLPLVWNRESSDTDPGVYAHQGSFGAAGLPAGWNRAPWSATRGADDGLSARARAVRLGVAITDLELAVASNDPRAAEIAGDVQRLLEPIPAAGAISQYYDGIAAGQVSGPAAEAPVRKAGLAITRLPDAEMVLTGAWLEAARLAAARRDAAFFATADSRERAKMVAAAKEVPAAARAVLGRSVPSTGFSAAGWTDIGRSAVFALESIGR